MAGRCILYYITDRSAFDGDEQSRRRRLLEKIAQAAESGIDYIQLREKDLPARELHALAIEAISVIREHCCGASRVGQHATALLINSQTDVALASNAAGVHLRADDISPQDVREIWALSRGARGEATERKPVISVSCHSVEDVMRASERGANWAVFAPVFEKKDTAGVSPTGLEALHQACKGDIPVLALGGVTLQNAESCLSAGAAGIAGIRIFQENEIANVLRALRG
jgi:thiamine-phosphate pyrophosphorylase